MIFSRGQSFRSFLLIFTIPILTFTHFLKSHYKDVETNTDTNGNKLRISVINENNNLTFTKFIPSATSPLIVILLSSLPRSGSSMMGQLISSMDNSVYFFEPFHPIRNSPCIEDAKCASEHLARYYNCYASKRKECERASSRVIKLVRGSLEIVGTILADSPHEVKMIHLTRDPRGSLRSIGSAGWDHDPEKRCKEVNEDMDAFQRLSEEYPGRIMNISYERFCVDSELHTKNIYKFLYGSDNLPERTVEFMKTHMNITEKGFTNTHRDTSSHYQEWRKEIKSKQFYAIENESSCKLLISRMGYNLFETVEKLKDFTNPLFV